MAMAVRECRGPLGASAFLCEESAGVGVGQVHEDSKHRLELFERGQLDTAEES